MTIITTNNQERPIIEAYELTNREREEYSYLDWPAIKRGEDSASFIRYRGQLYDLREFVGTGDMFSPSVWDGYRSDSFYSGIVVRWVYPYDCVVVGTYVA